MRGVVDGLVMGLICGLFFGGDIPPSLGGHSRIARIISGSQGGRTRQPAACVDPQGESIYNVDTFKENFYGSRHP